MSKRRRNDLRGVHFMVDSVGTRTAVVIDLATHAELWEDFYDRATAAARTDEPRESLASVKARLTRRATASKVRA